MRASLSSALAGLALLALAASGWSGTGFAQGAEKRAAGGTIVVDGARTLTADEILARAELRQGQRPDDRALAQAVERLMKTGLFADVRVARTAGALHITVTENLVVAAVTFEGASAIEKKQLEEATRLKPRERYTRARAHADANRIRDLYRKQGRLQTTVAPRAKEGPDGRVDVAFVISEGAVSKIERIAFAGNRAFSDRDLRDAILSSESGWFDILKSTAFYDPERTEADREMLRRHYLTRGFPDVRITDVTATLNAEKNAYTLTFLIDEGERMTFGAPAIDLQVGNVDSAPFATLAVVRAGDRYNQDKVDNSVEAMTGWLSQNGQPFARVRPVMRRARNGGEIGIVFRIEAGQPLYVERIEITGNARTKDHVIRRELRFAEGDPINPFLIERATRRLRRLGFFKSVEARPAAGSSPEKTVITIAVVEQETGELSFGGGYSTSEGVVGDISWTERNLLGNGQYLRLKLAGSLTRLQADIGFTEPHFLGSNVAAGFDLLYKDVDYTRQSSFKSQRAGGALRLGFPLSDETTIGANYSFVRNTLYDVGPAASAAIREAVPGYPDATSTSYNTSSVGSSVTYDSRDSKRRPTTGITYTLTQDVAGVGGDVRFVRSTGDARAYYPVSDSVTFMGRVTGGIIEGWGGQDVRLLDLFYKGGETVRGFATSGIGPRDTFSANRDALGGRMYAATTAETLFDIPGVPRDLGVRGAVFVDAGSLWGTTKTAAATPGIAGGTASLRASAGVGLVWDSPLGGLRADYAFPLVSQPYDKLQPFSFGMMGF